MLNKMHTDTLITSIGPYTIGFWPTCPCCGVEEGYMEDFQLLRSLISQQTHNVCGRCNAQYTVQWIEGRVQVKEGHA